MLSGLYRESQQFNEQAEIRMKAIHKELNGLNDALIRKGKLDYELGDLTREDVLELIGEATSLKEALESTQAFVESRLSDAVLMEKEMKSGRSQLAATIEGLPAEVFLKK
ncbi:hypothetical protein ACU063_10885 [Paenibacillus sp. M.A.Huq-81]